VLPGRVGQEEAVRGGRRRRRGVHGRRRGARLTTTIE
jgi:hypothetical protein